MRFLADESCDFGVVRALRVAGHDARAVAEDSPGTTDAQVAAVAAAENRVLITEDKDFGQLVFFGAGPGEGVVFIRCPGGARRALAASVVEAVAEVGWSAGGRIRRGGAGQGQGRGAEVVGGLQAVFRPRRLARPGGRVSLHESGRPFPLRSPFEHRAASPDRFVAPAVVLTPAARQERAARA
ncbi:MAG: DUF5615 family PIN-like protein [Thermoleophilia bacterium]|nr:DUF5615 family PIN-like protein [Thermoleophilia bacterium]